MRIRNTLAGTAGLAAVLWAGSSAAQSPAPLADDEAADVEQVVVTGTRFPGRIATKSPTPIDSITINELAPGGRTDLVSALKVAVPSFNSPSPTGSTFSDFATPVTLRGLSPGQVLVLVNGKRRHTIGERNQSNSLGRGDITYDINPIPLAAIGRLEVLRDGATAQYGSDAIGGVLNVVLDETLGASAKVTTGTTGEGDGDMFDLSLAHGAPIGDGGVVRASFHYRDQGGTNRAGLDTRQQYLGNDGRTTPSAFFGSGTGLTPSSGALDPRERTIDRDNLVVIGQSPYEITSGFLNARLPVSRGLELYGFGGYSRLEGSSDALLRRSGQDENVRSIFPDGYRPRSDVVFDDYTVSTGVRGGDVASLAWDLSTTLGGTEIETTATNTVNPSLGAASPTRFRRNGTTNRQWTTNLDFTRELPVGDSSPLKLALGFEYREDHYELTPGDPDSYRNGGAPIVGGPNNGRPAPVGSQPVPGIRNTEARSADRHSVAVYAEVDKELFDRLTLVGALRFEDFSDFGSSTDYKVAARFELTPGLALRANYGSGFRAPALAQSFFNASSASFVNGQLTTVRIFSVNEPAAALIGATPLRPETSTSLSFGAVASRGPFSVSIDAYRIDIDDRIVISSQFQDARLTTLLASNGYPGFAAATYLTNAVDSVTRGLDIAASYRGDFGAFGRLNATLAANFNESKLTRIAGTPAPLAALGINTPLFDLTQQVRFTDSQPKDKAFLSLVWDRDPFQVRLVNTRYGEVSAVALTNRTPAQVAALIPGYDVRLAPVSTTSANSDLIQTYDAKVLTDLEVSARVRRNTTFTVGVNNLLDVYPTVNLPSTVASVAAGTNGADNGGSVRYNPISPFGFNGRTLFASLDVRF
jgi:iron complex outermembrane recepter protein